MEGGTDMVGPETPRLLINKEKVGRADPFMAFFMGSASGFNFEKVGSLQAGIAPPLARDHAKDFGMVYINPFASPDYTIMEGIGIQGLGIHFAKDFGMVDVNCFASPDGTTLARTCPYTLRVASFSPPPLLFPFFSYCWPMMVPLSLQ